MPGAALTNGLGGNLDAIYGDWESRIIKPFPSQTVPKLQPGRTNKTWSHSPSARSVAPAHRCAPDVDSTLSCQLISITSPAISL